MKITFTVDQLKEYERLTPEQRHQLISSCEKLESLPEDEFDSFDMPVDTQLAQDVYTKAKRQHRNRMRRKKRAASADVKKQAEATSDGQINIDDAKARNAAWVRTNFRKFAVKTLDTIRMVAGNNTFANIDHVWEVLTDVIYRSLQPVFEYSAAYLEIPNSKRRPESIPLSSSGGATLPGRDNETTLPGARLS